MNPVMELRGCLVCKRRLPLDRFYASGHGNGRRNTCTRCINEQAERERRAAGAKIRHTRYNARGHVWCNHCQKYLPPEDFKKHPSRPGTYWSYCKPCVRILDRKRYREATSTYEGAVRVLNDRLERKHRQKRQEQKERKEYVAYVIDQLRQRGFTKAEVARLAQISLPTLTKWADPKTELHLMKPAELRMEILFNAVLDLPIVGYQDRRRLPHPEYARIHAITHDDVKAFYLRNSWINKQGEKARKA